MTHKDHVWLLKKAVPQGGIWADIGSGDGAFTLALRDIAGAKVEIYSIDRNADRLRFQELEFSEKFPNTNIHYVTEDFTRSLTVPPLDGILIANALHFYDDPVLLMKKFYEYLKPGGRLVLVGYNIDQGNNSVPYPFSFATFQTIVANAGFLNATLLETIESSFLQEIFSAVAYKKATK